MPYMTRGMVAEGTPVILAINLLYPSGQANLGIESVDRETAVVFELYTYIKSSLSLECCVDAQHYVLFVWWLGPT